jgi:hypothetical protein
MSLTTRGAVMGTLASTAATARRSSGDSLPGETSLRVTSVICVGNHMPAT